MFDKYVIANYGRLPETFFIFLCQKPYSFAGTVQRFEAICPYLWLYSGTKRLTEVYQLLLRWIAHDVLPHRPNRTESRVIKRRPKDYAWLTKPRHSMKEIRKK